MLHLLPMLALIGCDPNPQDNQDTGDAGEDSERIPTDTTADSEDSPTDSNDASGDSGDSDDSGDSGDSEDASDASVDSADSEDVSDASVDSGDPDDSPIDSGDSPVPDCTNTPPIAEPSGPTTVVLDWNAQLSGAVGAGSGDCEPYTPEWSVLERPVGSNAAPTPPDAYHPSFRPDLPGTYRFALRFTNAEGLQGAPAEVSLEGVFPQVDIQLIWDSGADLDLHLLDGSGALFQRPGDACYCNLNPDWGPSGPVGDPHFAFDARSFGPENIRIAEGSAGTYTVQVVRGVTTGSTNARVRIWVDGVEAADVSGPMNVDSQAWTVATLTMPAGTVQTIDTRAALTATSCFGP